MTVFLDGLSLGAMYAMIALGYTMVYGIAKMLNFAHGDVIMVGAYTIFTTLTYIINNPIVSVALAIIICIILGVVIEKLAYKPLRSASPFAVLITAIGVSYLLQGTAQLIFGSKQESVNITITGNVNIGSYQISRATVYTIIISTIIMVLLTLFIKKTRIGRAMIAVSEDRAAAQLMGINVNKIITITFAIGSALAAVASITLLQTQNVNYLLGAEPGIKAFTAAVIGGIGSIPGAVIGGVLLGIVENICKYFTFLNPYTAAIEYSLLIIILLFRPIGLLGKKRREKV